MTINDLINQFPDNLDTPLYLRETVDEYALCDGRELYKVTMASTECGFNTNNLDDEPVFTDILVLE